MDGTLITAGMAGGGQCPWTSCPQPHCQPDSLEYKPTTPTQSLPGNRNTPGNALPRYQKTWHANPAIDMLIADVDCVSNAGAFSFERSWDA